jgi:hypothetical protein
VLCFTFTAHSQTEVKLPVSPDQLYNRMINYGHVKNDKGEGFCWHARSDMDVFLNNYKITKNTEWLDAGVKYYDFLVNKMDVGPDGYKGWIGPYMYDDKYWIDSHVGDAILLGGMLEFSEYVLNDKDLKEKYGKKVMEYVELAKHDLIEKNDKRGTWKDDGPIGGYISYEKYMEPGNTKEWKYGKEVTKAGLSHPFNKQNDMGQVCLKLYRITKDQFYRDRAEKIFLRMKRQLQLNGDHYEWNYWEPLGIWDFDASKKRLNHWVGINPHVGYQAREVDQMVEAYHTGVVFDETDIKRMINTHLNIMWNKDKEHPAFTNSNVFHKPDQRQKEKEATGTLWTALMDFDPTVRELYEAGLKKQPDNSTEKLLYYNVTAKSPVSFKRKYVNGAVKLPKVDKNSCNEIRMAGVTPCAIKKGEKALIINFSWKAAETAIDLYSADGKKKIKELFKVKNDENLVEWDGTDPEKKMNFKGDYRIRWTLGNDYREFPISIN